MCFYCEGSYLSEFKLENKEPVEEAVEMDQVPGHGK